MVSSWGLYRDPLSCLLAHRDVTSGAYPAFREQVAGEKHLCSSTHRGWLFPTCCEASCPRSCSFSLMGVFV